MFKLRGFAVGVCLLTVLGCGDSGPKYVPVSGTVTLNGVPFDNASISFQPIGSTENPNPGRGSAATTDAQGRFKLMCDGTIDGAVVGKHRVRILDAGKNAAVFDPEKGSPDDAKPNTNLRAVPFDWADGKVEFDVPATGTTTANFEIKTKGAAAAPKADEKKDAPKADEKKKS